MENDRMSGIILNEDNSHFFSTRGGKQITEDDLASWVDQYAGTQVRELRLCANAMRTSYDSKAGTPIWEGYDPEGPDDQPFFSSLPPERRRRSRHWVHAAWDLADRGIDPYEIWISRCRENGISPWISVRMNDVHDVNIEEAFMHSSFWKEHPEYRRVDYRFTDWTDRAFDYRHEEVREYHMNLIEEIIDRYDFDGLELDWMRFGYHFAPGYEESGKEQLNRFTRAVRERLKSVEDRRGHTIKLSARVPSSPETALGLGLDAPRWAKDGLVDSLVITPFWWSIETDMPLEIWRYLLDGTSVSIAAGLEILLRPYPSYEPVLKNNIETVRGAAASFLSRGADTVYLFNYMDSETAMDSYDEYTDMLREAGSIETISGKNRRYPVTFTDVWIPGTPAAYLLPAEVEKGRFADFRIHLGRVENNSGWYIMIGTAEHISDPLEVRINGRMTRKTGSVQLTGPVPQNTQFYQVPPDHIHHGFNTVSVTAENPATLQWVELFLRIGE